MEIVQPAPASNLCMFFAIYNALESKFSKKAFSNNNTEEPAKSFNEWTRRWKTPEEIEKKGFTEFDMKRYLSILKSIGAIKRYEWKRMKNRHCNMHKILLNPPKEDEVFVLFGLCTTGENRNQLIKGLTAISAGKATTQEQVRRYHQHVVRKKESTDHAVALSMHKNQLLLSDTARKIKHRVTDMITIARSLVCVHCTYVLRLYV